MVIVCIAPVPVAVPRTVPSMAMAISEPASAETSKLVVWLVAVLACETVIVRGIWEQICVKAGPLEKGGDWTACLPNRLLFEVVGVEEAEVDAISY